MIVYATRSAGRLAIVLVLAAATLLPSGSLARPNLASSSQPTTHAKITGHARAIDGDTLIVGGLRVRLDGIDAPESDQTCSDQAGRAWACGAEATRVLNNLIGDGIVECEERGLDKYKRVLAICWLGRTDLNAEMVRRGLAWAFVRYSSVYVGQEAEARRARVGIWIGTAKPAWDYRAERWHTAEGAAPAGCAIKGNVSAGGRIYHLPWSPWYDKVHMDGASGKRWFCSEEEAIKAGWRPAKPN